MPLQIRKESKTVPFYSQRILSKTPLEMDKCSPFLSGQFHLYFLSILPLFNVTAFISKPLIFKRSGVVVLDAAIPGEPRPLPCSFVLNRHHATVGN